jgi:hypothetical protein
MGDKPPHNYTNRKVATHFLHEYLISLITGAIDGELLSAFKTPRLRRFNPIKMYLSQYTAMPYIIK